MGWSTHHPTGLIYHAPQHSYRVYTLVTNLRGPSANPLPSQRRIATPGHPESDSPDNPGGVVGRGVASGAIHHSDVGRQAAGRG